jgi:hypothetical protein
MIVQTFLTSLKVSLKIIAIITVLMVIVEILVLKWQDKIVNKLNRRFLKYSLPSFFGIIPGCMGTFVMDSFYMAGLLSFGGIIAVMIATSGDEAFLMLSMAATGQIKATVLFLLMLILFVLGILGGWLADIIKQKFGLQICEKCKIAYHPNKESKIKHFLKEHFWSHIIKKHIIRIFFWILAALFLISLGQNYLSVTLAGKNLFLAMLVASLLGLLPISGPNVFLVVMFSKGLIPFSVLLANSIIQDGHGMLPLLGFSLSDSLKIKTFNFIFGLTIGLILLLLGF